MRSDPNPRRIEMAVEEFLRFFTPVSISRDPDLSGRSRRRDDTGR